MDDKKQKENFSRPTQNWLKIDINYGNVGKKEESTSWKKALEKILINFGLGSLSAFSWWILNFKAWIKFIEQVVTGRLIGSRPKLS